MPKGIYKHQKYSEERKKKISEKTSLQWKLGIRKSGHKLTIEQLLEFLSDK